MTEESPIPGPDTRRIVLGGLAAGLMSNLFDFVITQYLMAEEFASILARLNVDESTAQSWIPLFALADFVWGFLLVFTYAAIRPRFGPGPRTAVIGAMMVWLSLAVGVLILLAIGLHTPQSYLESSALYLISAVASSLVGAALYRE